MENSFSYGYVVGALVHSVGDSDDALRIPDLIPASARPVFTRVVGQYVQPLSSPAFGVHGLMVGHQPVKAGIMPDGQITGDVDQISGKLFPDATPGLWLVTGRYRVETGLFPTYEIEVTTDHTEDDPLDISQWISYTPPEGVNVLTAEVPVEGEPGQVIGWTGAGLTWLDPVKPDPNELRIGTVQSGPTASATITGDAPSQTLSLTLPKGDKGDRGDKGDTGAPGALANASAYIITGPGRPDQPATTGGIITGNEPVGSEYRSQDGASVGAFVWMKRPGGKWEVVDGDTGWRAIFSGTTVFESSWKPGTFPKGGRLRLRRTVEGLWVSADNITFESAGMGFTMLGGLDSAWQVSADTATYPGAFYVLGGSQPAHRVDRADLNGASVGGMIRDIKFYPGAVGPGNTPRWPSTLPGTAA